MGTRSLTVFKENHFEKGEKVKATEIVVMYRQMDGYISGHGEELVKFIGLAKLCNGIPMDYDQRTRTKFNGMGCLTASVIAHFKTGIGEFYIHPAGTRGCCGEYIYIVENNEDYTIQVTVKDTYNKEVTLIDHSEIVWDNINDDVWEGG